ncbi:MAG TPA: bifunctional 4-hydroxy-2-oxoglutarate aldolase/2-dehydro-3-deoxy-phosphogluconate aldolase [Candidatus Limiplasma sp.]|nr:bifunctional 4-hydroxy-2-oxoglutarate aldolase/2-dehydro-3-deoxy-phosphogluconate aldolase [Candidatus Limiplasma sp.]
MDIIKQLSLAGMIPVIKITDAQDAVPLCRALLNGGLPVAEITFRTDAAEESIRRVHKELPGVMLGAGTVLTTEQVDRAVAAGATYIVSPGINPEVVKHCQRVGIPVIPGCSTASEIEIALSLGLKTVKFFPAEAVGGLKTIKALSAPYVDVNFVPTGGINEVNLLEYLNFSKIVACGGSWMVDQKAIDAKDWDAIETLTSSAVNRMLGFELKHIGINSGTPEQAMKDALSLAKILGWPVKDGNSSTFTGTALEFMKKPFRGAHGHIALGTNYIQRARWYLEQKGFAFDDESSYYKDGKLMAIYFKDEIAGFAFHLLQK